MSISPKMVMIGFDPPKNIWNSATVHFGIFFWADDFEASPLWKMECWGSDETRSDCHWLTAMVETPETASHGSWDRKRSPIYIFIYIYIYRWIYAYMPHMPWNLQPYDIHFTLKYPTFTSMDSTCWAAIRWRCFQRWRHWQAIRTEASNSKNVFKAPLIGATHRSWEPDLWVKTTDLCKLIVGLVIACYCQV